MEDIKIDVGVYTAFTIKLSKVDFTDIKEIILTIKNSLNTGSPAIIERVYTAPQDYTVVVTPEESLRLTAGAMYDFNKVDNDGKRFKISDNGKIVLRRGVGDCV